MPHFGWNLAYPQSMPDSAFTEWLNQEMRRHRLGDRQLGKMIGASHTSIRSWRMGFVTPSWRSAGMLAEHFKVDPRFVRQLVGYSVDQFVEPSPPERQELSPTEAILEALADLPILIPVVEQLAAAGEGQVAVDYVAMPPQRAAGRNIIALVVRGDSMEPEIMDGDYIVMDTDATARDGDTVVASVGDSVVVKQLRRKSDHFVLSGHNGKVIAVEDATIAGVVIQIVRDVPRG